MLVPNLEAGDEAPDFRVIDDSSRPIDLAGTGTGVRIFSVVPSLRTPISDVQTKRFNEESEGVAGVTIYCVSPDLPFAQRYWCSANSVEQLKMLSDHFDGSFGRAYGTSIPDLSIRKRALFVVDKDNVILYAEYVKQYDLHPNYFAALTVARKALTLPPTPVAEMAPPPHGKEAPTPQPTPADASKENAVSTRQSMIIWACTLTVIATCLYPPWAYTLNKIDVGYSWLFRPAHEGAYVDIARLAGTPDFPLKVAALANPLYEAFLFLTTASFAGARVSN